MITEDSFSDHQDKKPNDNDVLKEQLPTNTDDSVENTESKIDETENQHATQISVTTPEILDEKKINQRSDTAILNEEEPSAQDIVKNNFTEEQKINDESERTNPASENTLYETENSATTIATPENTQESAKENLEKFSLGEVLDQMENIINKDDAEFHFKKFNHLKERANQIIHQETENLKKEFIEAGNPAELFSANHSSQGRLSALINIFREKNNEFHKKQEEEQQANLAHRQNIIEKLRHLYTNTEAGTNLFKAIREIKEEWKNAGQVAKSEFKLLNNNYFHHLNQFYQMLDLNKEFLEQEYAHNLEKRLHIIERATELQTEPSVQKALNELQYLHKLWKEEAEPVAEELREKTWEEFKNISNKIHDRKSELTEQLEIEQNQNLVRKNEIIGEIKKMVDNAQNANHNYWQNAIKKVEELRSEFLSTGNVPRKLSNQNWNEFKQHLRNFNSSKNDFYKGLKNSQQTNLEEKLKLIATAKDNMLSEDWETTVPLFKKLQDDWKKIGHVPRSMTNKVWNEFREACNTFFNHYREKNNAVNDNWKENYKNKKQLLEELKAIGEEDGSLEKIEHIKTNWNNVGKVPREKISINSEFNKTLREKLKLNKIHEYDLKEEGLSENQLTDKARKIKNQITDLEAEIVKIENNLSFFSDSSRENPLLKDTYAKIDDKKSQLEAMKQSLHQILSGENQ